MEAQDIQGDKVPQEMQGPQWVEAPDFVPRCKSYPHITKQFLPLQGPQGLPGNKGDTVSIF